ncbi:hypothetical protein HDV06_001440 [Boothiomyces sp. JEL0866]|nr:hypothetical protein HDV06_001440 [Boothiomyces sp. JEL0866]
MKKFLLASAAIAQQSTFGGYTFNVSGNVYTSNGLWASYTTHILSEKVNLAACINDCKYNTQCTGFAYNGNTCYLKDVRIDDFKLFNQGAFPYDSTGFLLDRNTGCSDNTGQVTCQDNPINSGLTNADSSSNFQGFSMSVDQGMYSSTSCNFKQMSVVMNTTVASGITEKACQAFLKLYPLQSAYNYDTKNSFCSLYDLPLQSLDMISNSSSNCGFYLPESQSCYDDGSNVSCTRGVSSNSGSKTGMIVGVICGVLVAVVLVGVGFYFYRKKGNANNSKSQYKTTPNQSMANGLNSLGAATPQNNQVPELQCYYPSVPFDGHNRNSYVAGTHSPSATAVSPNYQRMSSNLPDFNTNTPKIVEVQPSYDSPMAQPHNLQHMNSMVQPPILNQTFSPMTGTLLTSELPILTSPAAPPQNHSDVLNGSIQPPILNYTSSTSAPKEEKYENIPPPVLSNPNYL